MGKGVHGTERGGGRKCGILTVSMGEADAWHQRHLPQAFKARGPILSKTSQGKEFVSLGEKVSAASQLFHIVLLHEWPKVA